MVATGFDKTWNIAGNCVACGACLEQCDFLPTWCGIPGERAQSYLKGAYKENPSIPFLCSLCSACSVACPLDLDTGEMMQEIRQHIQEEDIPLPGYVSLIPERHATTLSDDYLLFRPAQSGDTKRLFFPGCNLSAYAPETVAATFAWLSEVDPECGILLTCCGAPVLDAGHRETFEMAVARIKRIMGECGARELVLACSNCKRHLSEYTDGIASVSIYEIIAKKWEEPFPAVPETWSLHDPCKARFFPALQFSVRDILRKCGCVFEEPDEAGADTRCCGQGGMVAYTDYQWADALGKKRADALGERMITYCATCRETIQYWGPQSVHVLDLFFAPDLAAAAAAAPHDDTTRWANQMKTRELLSGA